MLSAVICQHHFPLLLESREDISIGEPGHWAEAVGHNTTSGRCVIDGKIHRFTYEFPPLIAKVSFNRLGTYPTARWAAIPSQTNLQPL